MAIVALLALDFWGPRTLSSPHVSPAEELIIFGIVPMANVLILGLFPFFATPGTAVRRPKRIGFEVFGAIGLLTLLTCCVVAPRMMNDGIDRLLWFLQGSGWIFQLARVVLLVLPQLALGWLGAWLFGKYHVNDSLGSIAEGGRH
jgi:hypothetical protein